MQFSVRSSPGNIRVRRIAYGLAGVALVGAVLALGPRIGARADDDEISALIALCNSPVGNHRKAIAIDALLAPVRTARIDACGVLGSEPNSTT